MDCADIERRIVAGESVSGTEARAHIAACATCRFTALEVAVLDRLAAERGPGGWLRSRSRAARLAVLAAAMAAAVLVETIARSVDWDCTPASVAIGVGACGGLALLLGWIFLRPIHLAPPRVWVTRAAVAAGLLVPVALAWPPLAARAADDAVADGAVCFPTGLLVAGAVFLVARAVDRGGVAGASALAAVAAGLAGVLALHLGCEHTDPLHLLASHATVPATMLVLTQLWRR